MQFSRKISFKIFNYRPSFGKSRYPVHALFMETAAANLLSPFTFVFFCLFKRKKILYLSNSQGFFVD